LNETFIPFNVAGFERALPPEMFRGSAVTLPPDFRTNDARCGFDQMGWFQVLLQQHTMAATIPHAKWQ
jgi:hypothetical protein